MPVEYITDAIEKHRPQGWPDGHDVVKTLEVMASAPRLEPAIALWTLHHHIEYRLHNESTHRLLVHVERWPCVSPDAVVDHGVDPPLRDEWNAMIVDARGECVAAVGQHRSVWANPAAKKIAVDHMRFSLGAVQLIVTAHIEALSALIHKAPAAIPKSWLGVWVPAWLCSDDGDKTLSPIEAVCILSRPDCGCDRAAVPSPYEAGVLSMVLSLWAERWAEKVATAFPRLVPTDGEDANNGRWMSCKPAAKRLNVGYQHLREQLGCAAKNTPGFAPIRLWGFVHPASRKLHCRLVVRKLSARGNWQVCVIERDSCRLDCMVDEKLSVAL